MANAEQDDLLGSLLDGRYRIVELLGRGGMGNVYLAEETRLKRRCAIKVMHAKLGEDRRHVERFLREAQMIAQLRHPNIVDIYAYGEEPSGVVWFAMELLTGEDLDARLKARAERPFSTHEGCVWAIQAARAVHVVHQAGLIHRDLKASNVYLAQRDDHEELVKLLDFGIARPEEGSELTTTGVALGTPSYMSPEQVRNATVDRRSDIYSFGVLLFKLLTGRLPFSGDAIQVAMAHCLAPVPSPSAVASYDHVSPELDALVVRAMAKVPEDRYQSMREVEEALIAVLRSEAPELAPAVKGARAATRPRTDAPTGAGGRTAAASPEPRVTAENPAAASMDPATGPTAAVSTGRRSAAENTTGTSTSPATGSTAAVSAEQRIAAETTTATAMGQVAGPIAELSPRRRGPSYVVPGAILLGLGLLVAIVLYRPRADAPRVPEVAPSTDVIAPGRPAPPEQALPPRREDTATPAPPAPVGPVQTPAAEPGPVGAPVEVTSSDPAVARKKPASQPAPRPPFAAQRAQDRLNKAVRSGAEGCYARHNAPAGFEFQVHIVVTADGKPRASGNANSALRKCLMSLVHDKISLGATASGGEFDYTFHSQ